MKVLEGTRHPGRDAQFRYIAGQVKEHMEAGQPVISVDAGKKEEIGDYAQAGREWHPKGDAPQVLGHSFPDRDGPGHAIPYGIYDVTANSGFVNAGTGANAVAFAVASLRQWHGLIGKDAYPDATRLLVTCDAGSSSGARNRAWKKELAGFAEDTGLEVTVCHLPPGASKWNQIGHRLFCQVSLAWRGRSLTSYDVIINTISAITAKTGLTATAVLDQRPYPAGQEITDAEIRDIRDHLTARAFHGDWNYTVLPVPRPAPDPAGSPQPASSSPPASAPTSGFRSASSPRSPAWTSQPSAKGSGRPPGRSPSAPASPQRHHRPRHRRGPATSSSPTPQATASTSLSRRPGKHPLPPEATLEPPTRRKLTLFWNADGTTKTPNLFS